VPSVLAQTATMRLRFVASDAPNNSVVEAALDDLQITTFDATPQLNLYGRRTAGPTTLANLTGPAVRRTSCARRSTIPTRARRLQVRARACA
jgi:hypothetical protein